MVVLMLNRRLMLSLPMLMLAACLPTVTTPSGDDPDASTGSDASTADTSNSDASSDPSDAEVDAGEDPNAFTVVSPASPMRLGIGGNPPESRTLSLSNTQECNGMPFIELQSMTTNSDSVTWNLESDEVVIEAAQPGRDILVLRCGETTRTVEVIVLPVPARLIPNVAIWSRSDIGVEQAEDANARITRWRNLARDDYAFAQGSVIPPWWSSRDPTPQVIFKRARNATDTVDINGLELQDPDGAPRPLDFEEMTALFVVNATTTDDRNTLIEGANGAGEYQIFLNDTPESPRRVGVRLRSNQDQRNNRERPNIAASGSHDSVPFGVVLQETDGRVRIVSHSREGSPTNPVTIESPSVGPNFWLERLGTSNANTTGEDVDPLADAFDGEIYEVLILDRALTATDVGDILDQMKTPEVF